MKAEPRPTTTKRGRPRGGVNSVEVAGLLLRASPVEANAFCDVMAYGSLQCEVGIGECSVGAQVGGTDLRIIEKV
jgi:hypothetical protein